MPLWGLNDDGPKHFRIALAVLDLVWEAAMDRPLLLVVEDTHWLDQPSVDVLSFVARLLESDPVVLIPSAAAPSCTLPGPRVAAVTSG